MRRGARATISCALAIAGVALVGPAGASAATINVTSGADSGAGSLRDAIASANPGDTIQVPALTVRLTSGQLVINRNLTIVGAGARATTISGTNTSRVFSITGGTVSISGVTVTEGNGFDKPGGTAGEGGGIAYTEGTGFTLADSTVTNNRTVEAFQSGGIVIHGGSGGTVSILRSTISFNSSTNDRAGGIGVFLSGLPVAFNLSDSTIAHNSLAPGGLGAGMYIFAGGTSIALFNDTFDLDFAGGTGAGSVLDLNGNVGKVPTTIANTIVLGGNEHSCTRMGETSSSAGGNIEDQALCKFTAAGDQTSTDPQLGLLQNNGGQQDTQLPAAGGPAIAVGNDALCPETDERGVHRPQGVHCDSGAVERSTPTATTPVVSSVTATSASVSASVNPALPGSFVYRYGTSTAYGSGIPSTPLLGFGLQSATASLTGLTPGTVYHVQLLVTTPDGSTGSSDASFTTAPAPVVTLTKPPATCPPVCVRPAIGGVSQSASEWREGNKLARISAKGKPPIGTKFSFSLSAASSLKLRFTQRLPGRRVRGRCVAPSARNAHSKRCSRTITAGTLVLSGHAGRNSVAFQGLISRTQKLKPGRYTLLITATNAGGTSTPASLSFKIVR